MDQFAVVESYFDPQKRKEIGFEKRSDSTVLVIPLAKSPEKPKTVKPTTPVAKKPRVALVVLPSDLEILLACKPRPHKRGERKLFKKNK